MKFYNFLLFQAPFNTVTVSAIGDDKALTFFRLESNGQINVNSNLKADSLDIYTVSTNICQIYIWKTYENIMVTDFIVLK